MANVKMTSQPDTAPDAPQLDEMNSVSQECQALKSEYDKCFHKWFSEKFLKGETGDACAPIFKSYQACVKKAIKAKGIELWDVERHVLGTKDEKEAPLSHNKGS